MKEISIAITDDDELVAKLLEEFLNKCNGFNVIFTACNGRDLIEKLEAESAILPEILLLNLKMKEMNGVDTIQHLKEHFPSIRIIVISSYYQNSSLGFLFKSGASAFVPKGISPVHLQEIITTVHQQGIYFTQEQVDKLRYQISSKTPKPLLVEGSELSKREIEILKLICMQKTAKEIGDALFITAKTVEGHKNNLFTKTGAKNVAGLVIYAIQNNILDLDDFPV